MANTPISVEPELLSIIVTAAHLEQSHYTKLVVMLGLSENNNPHHNHAQAKHDAENDPPR
jgi:hypothetical protein